jgi:periplasmic protein TonB
MTLPKETLDAVPAAKTAAPAPSKLDLNRLRADAVSLDVPVKVHGSRVTEVVRGVTPHTEPFEEETSTMIVFPHGGVVRMATVVSVGQMLVLTNLRTSQDAICRVVKVRAYSSTQAYVEVEFTHRQQGYWGVHFPADDEDPTASLAPAPPGSDAAEKKPVVASVSMKIESLPKPPAPPARKESAFAPIGSHEEVQPSAAQTESRPRVASVTPIAPPAPPVRVSPPPVAHVAPPAPVSVMPAPSVAPPPQARVMPPREILEAAPPEIEPEIEAEATHSSRAFGTLTGGTGRSAAAPDFGARLDSIGSTQAASAPAASSGNWKWMAACVFFLVAGLAAGAFYFRQHPSGASQSAPVASAPAQPAVQNAASATPSQGSLSAANPVDVEPPTTIPDHPARTVVQTPAQEPIAQPHATSSPAVHETKPAVPANSAPVSAPGSFAASASKPVARRAEGNNDAAAPTVSTAPAASPALTDVLNSSSAAPPPPPLQRVRVGGVINPPKLIRSVAPNYPTAARQSGIIGNVVINAEVDKGGNVGTMKVVSGPATLQAAAMTAMKQWKYQPATLDGDPIATQVTVTIKFQQQQ